MKFYKHLGFLLNLATKNVLFYYNQILSVPNSHVSKVCNYTYFSMWEWNHNEIIVLSEKPVKNWNFYRYYGHEKKGSPLFANVVPTIEHLLSINISIMKNIKEYRRFIEVLNNRSAYLINVSEHCIAPGAGVILNDVALRCAAHVSTSAWGLLYDRNTRHEFG